MIAENEISYNMQKQIKSSIYPDIYDEIAKGEDFELYGLSYAVNVLLAAQLGLPEPETPQEKMSRAARGLVAKLDLNVVEVPSEWFDLLGALIIGETWYRKDYPKFAQLVEKCGLVRFAHRFGAVPTDELEKIWKTGDKFTSLKNLIAARAAAEGYQLKFVGSGKKSKEKSREV